jgi:predicted ArsR family transcriptional regulator
MEHPAGLPATEMSGMRRTILGLVKRRGSAAIAELAGELQVSYEAVRQQVTQLHREGWLQKRVDRGGDRPRVGRPQGRFRLTVAGDHVFPKHYDLLSVELLDAVAARSGEAGLREVLGALADARVKEWLPRLEGLDLEARLELLRGIYFEDDPFVSVERAEGGGLRLVERNCPFLNVAAERPAICSLTVAVLSRLLGRRVVREERFQDGDGRCAFRVLEERARADEPFRFEAERATPRPEKRKGGDPARDRRPVSSATLASRVDQ